MCPTEATVYGGCLSTTEQAPVDAEYFPLGESYLYDPTFCTIFQNHTPKPYPDLHDIVYGIPQGMIWQAAAKP